MPDHSAAAALYGALPTKARIPISDLRCAGVKFVAASRSAEPFGRIAAAIALQSSFPAASASVRIERALLGSKGEERTAALRSGGGRRGLRIGRKRAAQCAHVGHEVIARTVIREQQIGERERELVARHVRRTAVVRPRQRLVEKQADVCGSGHPPQFALQESEDAVRLPSPARRDHRFDEPACHEPVRKMLADELLESQRERSAAQLRERRDLLVEPRREHCERGIERGQTEHDRKEARERRPRHRESPRV